MPGFDLELKPVDFLTVGTVGPRGQRVFYLQGAKGEQLVSLILEKMQVSALAEAIRELLADLDAEQPDGSQEGDVDPADFNLELRDPIQPEFRVAQIGLGYDEASDLIILITHELISSEDEEAQLEPGVVRFWSPRSLLRAVAVYAEIVIERGRPDPKKNGRIHYYWT